MRRALFQNTIQSTQDYPELRLYLAATVSPTSTPVPGTVTFSPSGGSYSRGQSVTLTANPAAGWRFDRWTGELSGINNPATITMDFDKTVTANFLWPPSVTTNPATNVATTSATLNGNLDALGNAVSALVSFEWGTTANYGVSTPGQPQSTTGTSGGFSADIAGPSPATTYYFRAKAEGGSGEGTGYGAQQQFTTDVTIAATVGANGTISPSGAVMVNYGDNQVFYITPNTGYHVADVVVDGVSVGARTSYGFSNVTTDHTISATFAIDTYTITAAAGANGTISPPGAVTVNHGSDLTFTITPATGYHVDSVLVDGNLVGAVTSYPFTNVTANHTITASFAINSYSIAVTQSANGTISPSTTTVTHGGSQAFTISPNTGYHVDSLVVDSAAVTPATSYTFTNVTANHTLSATFAINSYTITASAGPNGTITPSGVVPVSYGTNQAFSITPAPGYEVENVLVDGGSVGAVASHTFTNVTANHTISATFVINPTITTSSLPSGEAGLPYSQTLLASGGVPPYAWSVPQEGAGSLPPGLTLGASTGVIGGTPTGPGTFNFTVVLTDSVGGIATRPLSIVVDPAMTTTTARQRMWLFEPIRGLGTNLKPGDLTVQAGGESAIRRAYVKVTSPTDPTSLVMFGVERSAAYPNSAIFYYDSNEAGYTYLPDAVAPEIFRNFGVYITDVSDPGLGYRYQLWVDGQLKRDDMHVPARDQIFEHVSEAWGTGGVYTVESSPSVFREPILYKQTWAEWWDPYQPTRWYFNSPDSSDKPPIREYHRQDPWAFAYETNVLNLGYANQRTTNPDYAGIIGYLRAGSLNMNATQSERHYAAAVVGQMTGADTDSYVMVGIVRTNDDQQWRFFTYDNDDAWGYIYHGVIDANSFNYFAVNLFGSDVAPWGYEYWVVINGNAVRYGRLRTPDPARMATYVSVEDQLWTAAATYAGAEDTRMANFKSPQLLLTWYGGIQDWNDTVATIGDYGPPTQPVKGKKWQDASDSNRYRFQFAVDTVSQPYRAGSASKQINNYGGEATIGWKNPTVVDSSSEEWIMSGLAPEANRYLRIGWRKDIRSESAWASPKAWLQYVDATTDQLVDRYSPQYVQSGDFISPSLFYYQGGDEWLGQVSTPSWGWTPEPIPWATLGFRQATRFQASGETWWLSDQIGGTGQQNAVEFRDITYFSAPDMLGAGSPGFVQQDYSASDPAYGVEGLAPIDRNFRNWSNP